jgi:hypothetical protein
MFVRQNYSATGVRVDQLKALLAEPILVAPETVSASDADILKVLRAELSVSNTETVLATTWLSSILPSTMRLIMMPM